MEDGDRTCTPIAYKKALMVAEDVIAFAIKKIVAKGIHSRRELLI
jgi:hypothetical protein